MIPSSKSVLLPLRVGVTGFMIPLFFVVLYAGGFWGYFAYQELGTQKALTARVSQELRYKIQNVFEIVELVAWKLEKAKRMPENLLSFFASLPLPDRYILPQGSRLSWEPGNLANKTCVFHQKTRSLRITHPLSTPFLKGCLILEISTRSLLRKWGDQFQIIKSGPQVALAAHASSKLHVISLEKSALLLKNTPPPVGSQYLQTYGSFLMGLVLLAQAIGMLTVFWGRSIARQVFQRLQAEMAQSYAAQAKAEKALALTYAENVSLVAMKEAYQQGFEGQFPFFKALTERFRLWAERVCGTALALSNEHVQTLSHPPAPQFVIEPYKLFGAPQMVSFVMSEILDRLLPIFAPLLTEKSLQWEVQNRAAYVSITNDPLILSVILANILAFRLSCSPQESRIQLKLQRHKDYIHIRLLDHGYKPYEGRPFHGPFQKAFFTLPSEELEILSRSIGITFSFPASKDATHVLLIELPLAFAAAEEIPLPTNVLPFPRAR